MYLKHVTSPGQVGKEHIVTDAGDKALTQLTTSYTNKLLPERSKRKSSIPEIISSSWVDVPYHLSPYIPNCLQFRRPKFHPWVGKIPCRREWLPSPVFLPGEFHRQKSLAVRGVRKSWT